MRMKRQSEAAEEPRTSTSESPLSSGAISMGSAQVVKRVFRLFALLIAARALGPAQFGVYTVLLTLAELVAIFSGTGYAEYLTREIARNANCAGPLLLKLTALRCVYLMAGVAVGVTGLWLFGFSQAIITGTVLMAIAMIPRSVNELEQGILRGHQRFRGLVVIETTQGIALLIAALTYALQQHDVRSFVIAEIISASVGALTAIVITIPLICEQVWIVSQSFRSLLRATFAFNLYPLIVNVYDRADVLLLSRLAGDSAVGIYGLPYRVFATLQIIPYSVMGALLPRLCRSEWTDESERLCVGVMRGAYAVALFIILAATLFATPALLLSLGQRYVGADTALKILIWAVVPVFFNSIFNTVLLALNRERMFLLTASVCTAVNVAANVILIPHYSYLAAALVTVLTESVLLTQNVFFIRRFLGYVPRPPRMASLTIIFAVLYLAGTLALRLTASWLAAAIPVIAFAAIVHHRGDIPNFWTYRKAAVVEIEVGP